MTAHAHTETCRHTRRRDTGAVAMFTTGCFFFVAPFLNAAIGGPHLGGPVLCGLRALLGVPCPACGLTTSFTFAARGQLDDAFRAAPLGPVLWVLALAAAVWGATLIRRNAPLELDIFPRPVRAVLVRWWAWLPAAILFSWAYQFLRVNVWGLYV